MKLNTFERLTILNVLPQEGDLTTIKLVRQAREELSFSAEEHEALKFVTSEDGNTLTWNSAAETEKDYDFPVKITAMIRERFVQLNKDKKLTEAHLTLCEKFEVE